jgi:hypothetical protein
MTELERYDPLSGDALNLQWKLAERLARTDFVPRDMRGKPDAILACILTGRELGIGPMQSLRDIFIQNGRPGMAATLMVDRARAAGHRVRTLKSTATEATVQVHRKGEPKPELPVTWTLDHAKTAGLLSKDNWRHYPTAMLWNRAAAAAVRRDASEVLGGVCYTPEELGEARGNGQLDQSAPAPVGPPAGAGADLEGAGPLPSMAAGRQGGPREREPAAGVEPRAAHFPPADAGGGQAAGEPARQAPAVPPGGGGRGRERGAAGQPAGQAIPPPGRPAPTDPDEEAEEATWRLLEHDTGEPLPGWDSGGETT